MVNNSYVSIWVLVVLVIGSLIFITAYTKFSKKTPNSDTFDKLIASSIISLFVFIVVIAVSNAAFSHKIVYDNPVKVPVPERIAFFNVGEGPLLLNDYTMNEKVVQSKISESLNVDDVAFDETLSNKQMFLELQDYQKVSFTAVQNGEKINGAFYFIDRGMVVEVNEKVVVKDMKLINIT